MSIYSSVVENNEEHGTAHEAYDEDRGLMTAQVTLRCAYDDRHTLVGDICGNLRAWPKGSASSRVPLAYGAGVECAPGQGGTAGSGEMNPFEALVTIHYTTKSQETVTESFEPTIESIPINHRMFRWGSGTGLPVREDEAPKVLVHGMSLVRNELLVIPPISNDVLDLVDTVNQDPYYSLFFGRTFDAETLLYQTPVVNRKFNSLGDIKYDLTKKWLYNAHGWNTFFNALTNSYLRLYLAGAPIDDPYYVFQLSDMSNILPPAIG